MTGWIMREIAGPIGQPGQLGGQAGAANFQFVLRWLGRPSASGRGQILITMWDWPTCSEVFRVVYRWWTRVPPNISADGWRMVPCRWMS